MCCYGDGSPGGGGGGGSEKAVDISRLDFRIGRILKAWKHPDADTLYVEEGERECMMRYIYTHKESTVATSSPNILCSTWGEAWTQAISASAHCMLQAEMFLL